jgi:hypothetical protein
MYKTYIDKPAFVAKWQAHITAMMRSRHLPIPWFCHWTAQPSPIVTDSIRPDNPALQTGSPHQN